MRPMSSTITSGAFALAGVALGATLNWITATRTRKQANVEERERERPHRAEHLDEALVRVSAALDLGSAPLSGALQQGA